MNTELDDLNAQIAELQNKRQAMLNEQRETKLKEVKTIIQQFGFTASDLGITGTNKKTSGSIKPALEAKYVNPNDSSLTWHGGRGARPAWVNEYLNGGGQLVDIEIKK